MATMFILYCNIYLLESCFSYRKDLLQLNISVLNPVSVSSTSDLFQVGIVDGKRLIQTSGGLQWHGSHTEFHKYSRWFKN
jgi:hypothetical protein